LDSSFLDEQIRIDSEQLASFGYKQELRRTLSTLSNFAVAFSYISVSTGIFALFSLGLGFGGPAFIWSWPIVMVGQFFVALNFAELASHFPIAGSIYQWTRQLASRGYAWFTGWIYLFAGILTVTSVAFTLTGPFENLFNITASTTANVIITIVVLIVSTVINVAGIRLLSLINNIGVGAEILGMAVFAVILLIVAHHQPLSVITNTANTGVGNSSGYAGMFMTAMFMSLFVVYGFDTAGTLAEETKDPTRQVPKAILGALGVSFVIGAIFLTSVLVAIPNVTKAVASGYAGGTPLLDTINAGLPEFWAKTYLVIVCVAIFVCTLSIQAATIRLAFGMARDKQLPGSSVLSIVVPSLGTPAYTGIVIGILAGLPLFVSQQLLNIVTGATGLIYISYLMCNIALFRARISGWPEKKAPFSLGPLGFVVNVLAIAWGGSMLVNFAWLRAATNPPIGLGPGWIADKAIFELLIVVIVGVGAIYYTLFVRPKEAAAVGAAAAATAR
jgi:urea carboxylase system permease